MRSNPVMSMSTNFLFVVLAGQECRAVLILLRYEGAGIVTHGPIMSKLVHVRELSS